MNYDYWRLQTPEEYFGREDYCDSCPCAEPNDPRPLWEDEDGELMECKHTTPCGCDQCECSCHFEGDE